MGKRFQVFLIARVSPPKGSRYSPYRCVGAFHHQWCYELLPVRALRRFFSLLRARENAALVRDELRIFDKHHDRESDHIDPALPCPYTVSLLSIAWTTDLEHQVYISNYSFATGLIDARKGCWDRANNAGICIIDITNVDTPAYCFVNVPGSSVLSAYQYLRLHMPDEFCALPLPRSASVTQEDSNAEREDMGRFKRALEIFWALVDVSGYPILSASALCDIWPNAATECSGHKQLKVPLCENWPMPIDVVISLYLGFADRDLLATFAKDFRTDQPHVAIGKCVLPPFDGCTYGAYHRTSVIRCILAEQRALDFVVEAPYPPDGPVFPVYTVAGERERFEHLVLERARIAAALRSAPSPVHLIAGQYLEGWRLATILTPARMLSARFGSLQGFRDSHLGNLAAMLQMLDSKFIDLSGLQLTLAQVIAILRNFPKAEALSISDNKFVQPEHLPCIIMSAPALRRVHAMHFNLKSFPVIHRLMHDQPAAFRQLESLACPPLLSQNRKVTWPASFIFNYCTQETIERPASISVPFCTPDQVVQALTEILPLAFLENRYGESAELLYRNPEFSANQRQVGPNSFAAPANGFPFYMAAQMCVYAALASSAILPRMFWNERPFVGVPLNGPPCMLRDTNGGRTWMFCFDWDYRRHQRVVPGKNMWGFVRCEMTVHGPPGDPEGIDTPPELLRTTYSRTVHDLRGYLRCMADEGRPLPEADLVKWLESILDTQDPITMEPICALMTEDDLEPMFTKPYTEQEGRDAYEQVYGGLTKGKTASLYSRSVPNFPGVNFELRLI